MDAVFRMRLNLRALGLFRIGLALLTLVAVAARGGSVAPRVLAAAALLPVTLGLGTTVATLVTAGALWLAAASGARLPIPLLFWWLWTPFLPWGARLSVDAVRRSLAACPEKSAADLNAPARWPEERSLGAAPTWMLLGALAALVVLLAFGASHAAVDPLALCAAALGALLLPGERAFAALRQLGGRLAAPPTLVYYDSDCGICSLIARILKRLDRLDRLTWVDVDPEAPLPGDWTRERLDEVRTRTLVAWAPGEPVRTRHLAVGRTLAALPGGRLLAWPFGLPGLGLLLGRAYDQIARNRHRISARLGLGVCGLPPPVAVERRPLPRAAQRAIDVARVVLFAGGVAWLATR